MAAPAHALFRNTCSKPISLTEFRDVLAACRPPIHSAAPKHPRPRFQDLALAVSGGVDSMAMAWLVSKTIDAFPGIKIGGCPTHGAVGIVIDHGLRPNSAHEASRVASALRDLCIAPHVKTISLSSVSPGPGSSVESLARKMRFRKLGLTCLDLQIFNLLLAHHRDDQHETVLMRLALGHCYRGLQGIMATNAIPECHDLHGVSKSGLLSSPPISRPQGKRRKKISPLEYERGGVTIHRPLLEFDKDQLMATCEANKVPWFQDDTNFDQTLTLRNAIRHMVQAHQLPQALQRPAINAMCQRAKARAAHEDQQAHRWLVRHGVIRDLNTNGGTLLVTFPPRGKRWNQRRRLFAKARLQRRRIIAALVVRKLIDFVTPELQLQPVVDLHTPVDWLFPELRHRPQAETKGFTISGVLFSNQGSDSWLLTRTPYPSNVPLPDICLHTGGLPLDRSLPSKHLKSRETTAPVLWDGRFWIRLESEKGMDLRLLPLLPEHLQQFRLSLSAPQRDAMNKCLKKYAPGKARFTLPAIYCSRKEESEGWTGAEKRIKAKEQGGSEEETEVEEQTKAEEATKSLRQTTDRLQLLALPTLGFSARHSLSLVSFKAMYKAVDYVLLKACQDEAKKPAPPHRVCFMSTSRCIRTRRLAASRNKARGTRRRRWVS